MGPGFINHEPPDSLKHGQTVLDFFFSFCLLLSPFPVFLSFFKSGQHRLLSIIDPGPCDSNRLPNVTKFSWHPEVGFIQVKNRELIISLTGVLIVTSFHNFYSPFFSIEMVQVNEDKENNRYRALSLWVFRLYHSICPTSSTPNITVSSCFEHNLKPSEILLQSRPLTKPGFCISSCLLNSV